AGQPADMTPSREPTRARGLSLSFQTRLTLTLLAAAIVPLGVFGLVLIATGTVDPQVGSRLLLFMFAVAVAVGILAGAAIGVAIRNAELFTQVQEKNVQLRQLSEVKDDFLRGVSHNLQTPLTSIKSNAEAIAASNHEPDARLTVISDQADRLTRMVQQLLLV